MRNIFVFCFYILAIIQASNAQSLKVICGDLYLLQQGERILIKSDKDSDCFRGYDIIDSNHVFVSYEPHGIGDAATILAVIDIDMEKEIQLTESLGGTGASIFEYNSRNDLILFDSYDGVYILKVHDSTGNVEPYKRGKKPKKILTIDPHQGAFTCFWVDAKSYGVRMHDKVSIHEVEWFNKPGKVTR